MNVRTSTNTRIGAIQWEDDIGGVHIRVYYQSERCLSLNVAQSLKHRKEAGYPAIGELCHDGKQWYEGSLRLPGALVGTSIAAVAYSWNGETQIRVYYQAGDLSLREHCHDTDGWYPGQSSMYSGLIHLSGIGTLPKAHGALAVYQVEAPSMPWLLLLMVAHRFKYTGVIFKRRSSPANTPNPGGRLPKFLEVSGLASSLPYSNGRKGSISGSTIRIMRTSCLNIVATTVAKPGSQGRYRWGIPPRKHDHSDDLAGLPVMSSNATV